MSLLTAISTKLSKLIKTAIEYGGEVDVLGDFSLSHIFGREYENIFDNASFRHGWRVFSTIPDAGITGIKDFPDYKVRSGKFQAHTIPVLSYRLNKLNNEFEQLVGLIEPKKFIAEAGPMIGEYLWSINQIYARMALESIVLSKNKLLRMNVLKPEQLRASGSKLPSQLLADPMESFNLGVIQLRLLISDLVKEDIRRLNVHPLIKDQLILFQNILDAPLVLRWSVPLIDAEQKFKLQELDKYISEGKEIFILHPQEQASPTIVAARLQKNKDSYTVTGIRKLTKHEGLVIADLLYETLTRTKTPIRAILEDRGVGPWEMPYFMLERAIEYSMRQLRGASTREGYAAQSAKALMELERHAHDAIAAMMVDIKKQYDKANERGDLQRLVSFDTFRLADALWTVREGWLTKLPTADGGTVYAVSLPVDLLKSERTLFVNEQGKLIPAPELIRQRKIPSLEGNVLPRFVSPYDVVRRMPLYNILKPRIMLLRGR
jgi:hypothetical protein